MSLSILAPSVPSSEQIAAIRSLAAAGHRLSDQALTQLHSATVTHVVAVEGSSLVGYAQLSGDSLEIAAESEAIDPLLDHFTARPLLVWSHGADSNLSTALAARGFSKARELHQLRRPLTDPVEVPEVPDGVRVSTFTVGVDEDAWLQVNAAAFADHPEQGRWVRADIEAREQEEWFDPAGFFLAWRDESLLGFHWTKVHPDGAGEVYVIGVDPDAQGLGLGAVLLLTGLESLRTRGCGAVLLYVDGSNTGALRLYERYGFSAHDLDIQWRSSSS